MHPVFETAHRDSRDRRPSHTSSVSTSASYSDKSSPPSPITPDTILDSPSSYTNPSDFPAPHSIVPTQLNMMSDDPYTTAAECDFGRAPLIPFVRQLHTQSFDLYQHWLEFLIKPVPEPLTFEITQVHESPPSQYTTPNGKQCQQASDPRPASSAGFGPSSLPPSAFQALFLPTPASLPPAPSYRHVRSTSATYPASTLTWDNQAPTSTLRFTQVLSTTPWHIPSYPYQRQPTPAPQPLRTRPLKVLIYSADGYTEPSSLTLCLLMAFRKLSLPEAYLELQIEKKWSFFVYQNEVVSIRRVESRLEKEHHHLHLYGGSWGRSNWNTAVAISNSERPTGRPPAQSVSFATPPSAFLGRKPGDDEERQADTLSMSNPTQSSMDRMMASGTTTDMANRRPRATTMSVLPSSADHQAWFNDPRFDGSFPSRVLSFLYLRNLNHASNVYMLHALGITHVVSVGEGALVPPPLQSDIRRTLAHVQHIFSVSVRLCVSSSLVKDRGARARSGLRNAKVESMYSTSRVFVMTVSTPSQTSLVTLFNYWALESGGE